MTENGELPSVGWWVEPGASDAFAWGTLVFMAAMFMLVISLYARFERYAEHKSRLGPLRTTVPTLLMLALAYEVFPPLKHFSALLPIALIAAALGRDLMLWFRPDELEDHDG